MLKNKNIIVTGGAGFIGSNLVQHLLTLGNKVTVIDNFSTGSMDNMNSLKGACFVEADICNYPVMKHWFEGTDIIFHMAAISNVQLSMINPLVSNNSNVSGTLTVLDAAKATGVKRVIFSSSAAVYGNNTEKQILEWAPTNPISPYGLTKWMGEQYCSMYNKLFGLNTTILRYFNVFGERQSSTSDYSAVIPKFITAMLKGERPTIYGDGEQTRDFTYVQNVVNANALAANSEFENTEVYNIASGCSISINDLLYKLNDLMGTNIEAIYVPAKPGDIEHSGTNINYATRRIGYNPEITITEGLDRTIKWYLNQATSKRTWTCAHDTGGG